MLWATTSPLKFCQEPALIAGLPSTAWGLEYVPAKFYYQHCFEFNIEHPYYGGAPSHRRTAARQAIGDSGEQQA